PAPLEAGRADEERHVDRAVEEKLAMEDPPVLHELLAMIGGDDHDRPLEEAARLEIREQRAELGIQIGDLAVVETAEEAHVALRDLDVRPLARERELERPQVALDDPAPPFRIGLDEALAVGRGRLVDA